MKNYLKILVTLSLLLVGCSHFSNSVNENVTAPLLKNDPKLIYPFVAQQNNIYGTSTVLFNITKEGVVSETRVHKSSGFEDLDKAAENYCKQLEFIPAKENGTPISSTMRWEVKFNLEDFGNEIKIRIAEVKDLYEDFETANANEKNSIQKDVLKVHDKIISKTKDGLKLNEYLYQVVLPEIRDEWQYLSESYPLTFLLYHDFVTRYSEYDQMSEVKSRLKELIKQDLRHLVAAKDDTSYNGSKSTIMQKIKTFVENNYPDINLDEFELEIKLKRNNIS